MFREGEELSAAKLTELARSLDLGAPAGYDSYRGQIAPARFDPMVATIASGSGPYSWTEAVYIPGTGWVDGPRSGSGDAYEVNGQTVASGKRVRLYPNLVRGWDFQFHRKGLPEIGGIFCCSGATFPQRMYATCKYGTFAMQYRAGSFGTSGWYSDCHQVGSFCYFVSDHINFCTYTYTSPFPLRLAFLNANCGFAWYPLGATNTRMYNDCPPMPCPGINLSWSPESPLCDPAATASSWAGNGSSGAISTIMASMSRSSNCSTKTITYTVNSPWYLVTFGGSYQALFDTGDTIVFSP